MLTYNPMIKSVRNKAILRLVLLEWSRYMCVLKLLARILLKIAIPNKMSVSGNPIRWAIRASSNGQYIPNADSPTICLILPITSATTERLNNNHNVCNGNPCLRSSSTIHASENQDPLCWLFV